MNTALLSVTYRAQRTRMMSFEPGTSSAHIQPVTWGAPATLASLRNHVATVCEAELRRLDNRVPGLDTRSRDEVARAIQRVVDGLFGDLGSRLARDAALVDALRVLFALDPSGGAQ